MAENAPLPEATNRLRPRFSVGSDRSVTSCEVCGRYFVRRSWEAKEPWVLGEEDTYNQFESIRPLSWTGLHDLLEKASSRSPDLADALVADGVRKLLALPAPTPAEKIAITRLLCGALSQCSDPPRAHLAIDRLKKLGKVWASDIASRVLRGEMPTDRPSDLANSSVRCPSCRSSEVDLETLSGDERLAHCQVCGKQEQVAVNRLGKWAR